MGNYVTIQDGTYNSSWVIVGFDIEDGRGDTNSGKGIGLIPYIYTDTMTSYMNSTATTTGGYQGSYMHNTTLPNIASKLNNILGSHMIERRISTSNAVNNGASSNWSWESQKLSLLSEVQVYGSIVWGGKFDVGEACYKLPIFNYVAHSSFDNSNYFWLRAVTSTSDFALATIDGRATNSNAFNAVWVRPLLYIR